MTTLNDLINSIHSSLHSYTGLQELSTYTVGSMTNSATSVTVFQTDYAMRGVVEIDDELVYVMSTFDSGGNTNLTIAPFGRGFRGSTATTHSTNAQVTFDPTFPRAEIRKAIDQCVAGLFPTLYQIKTTTITFDGAELSYPLPADCAGIIEAKWHAPGDPVDYWQQIGRWSFDPSSPLVGGRALNVMEGLPPGSSVRVVYMANFGTFTSGTDTLASVGLSESMADVILYGVTGRLVRFLDPARLQLASVENVSRSSVVASGDASKVANQLYAMYQQRLAEERLRLLNLTPPQIHFTR